MKSRAREGAGGDDVTLPHGAHDFVSNLRRAVSGDPDAAQHMGNALRTATLRDVRLDRIPDPRRAQGRFESDRAAERALTAVNKYARLRAEGKARWRSYRA